LTMKSFFRLRELGWLLLLIWVPLSPAQISISSVQKIEIKHVGPQAVSDELVKANIRVKVGDPYLRTAVDEDVRGLYGTGFFYNIQVSEQRDADGVILTYILQSKPRLTDIKFTGNKKYGDAKLRKKSDVQKSADRSMSTSCSLTVKQSRRCTRKRDTLAPKSNTC